MVCALTTGGTEVPKPEKFPIAVFPRARPINEDHVSTDMTQWRDPLRLAAGPGNALHGAGMCHKDMPGVSVFH